MPFRKTDPPLTIQSKRRSERKRRNKRKVVRQESLCPVTSFYTAITLFDPRVRNTLYDGQQFIRFEGFTYVNIESCGQSANAVFCARMGRERDGRDVSATV